MARCILAIIGATALALAATGPAAVAQTNIDQGKSPAEIFAADCAACHKSTRGLAGGKNSLTLSSFLREHYTSSRDQAAAMAAYVLGNGGSAPAAPGAGARSGRAALEEPKTGGPKGAEPRTSESKPTEPRPGEPRLGEPKPGEPKPQGRAVRAPSRPAEEAPSNAKPQRPLDQESLPATTAHEQIPEPTVEPAVAAPVPAASAAPPVMPELGATTSAVTPAESPPAENQPVPRDNIPD